MPKKLYKHQLVFDENMPHKTAFQLLNNLFDIKHIRDDYKQSGIADRNVYLLAVSENRIIITYNVSDFKPFAGIKNDAGIIGLPPEWPLTKIDKKLCALLKKNSPNVLKGKFIALSQK